MTHVTYTLSHITNNYPTFTYKEDFMMNVGGIDRILRIVIGAAVIGWGVYSQNWWGAVGAVPLLTGLIGWCPAYLPFGFKTCKIK